MVYILLGEGFEEVEALCAADVLRRGGVEVTTTGLDRRTVVGSHGIPVTADAVAADVELAAGDMVVLPGGLGGVAASRAVRRPWPWSARRRRTGRSGCAPSAPPPICSPATL